ncbi:MAG: dihydrolipoyl dehydrogenase [Bacteroidetes bacterium]|nr:dihydrolipoyl dehydrogenase [Bacteroidota bacterium]MBU1718439.1 dihydrolipoyl dehydrogenase [Bacteroidota bacterium]
MTYDVIVIGSGPGGYVAAIRASQLGMKTAVVERSEPGGICLNWGCIPTKALLKSAQVFEYAKHAADYGVQTEGSVNADFPAMVNRSREVAATMSKGIQYLFRKNKIDLLQGTGKLQQGISVEVTDAEGKSTTFQAKQVILATGARSRELPNLLQDGKYIIGYREALTLDRVPESMVVVGSGAIGTELAFLYQTLGCNVTLVEFLPEIIPTEDEEVSKQMARNLKKMGMKVMTKSSVEKVAIENGKCKVQILTSKGTEDIEAEIVLSAVGITSNLENIGIEELGIKTENGKILVDEFYRTNVSGVYAIGDLVPGPALAHVASAEAIVCVEKIAGLNVEPVDYKNIPGCIYTSPEVASVGISEKKAIEAGYELKVGKFPFTASGKATAAGTRDGFIKVIFDARNGQWLGAHFIGANVTEMIAEAVVARKLGATGHEILKSIHPHPTMSEAIMEAVAAAYNEAIHI